MTDIVLARLDQARLALQEASTIPEVKRFVDLAATAETWARQQKLGDEILGYAREFRVDALQRLGEMLKASERATGGDAQRTRFQKGTESPPTLSDLGLDKKTSALAQKIAALPDSQLEAVRKGTLALTKAHVGHATGESEWYTPGPFTKAAKRVMGRIDLDPASSGMANTQIGARAFYSKEDDGRSKPWNGRVWMNPPYAQPLIRQFCEKLASEFERGSVTEAIVLVNNATETDWFQTVASSASAVCFPTGRVRFWNESGESGAPLQGQAILYLGENVGKFLNEYLSFGICAKWVRTASTP